MDLQLGISQQPPGQRDAGHDNAAKDSVFPAASLQYSDSISSTSQYAGTPQSYPSAPLSSSTSSTSSVVRPLDLHDPDALLRFYQEHVADSFPFIVIPPETTAYYLLREKPLLFKTIVMVASAQDSKAQEIVAEEIVEYLSLHLIMRSENTLDMLQGLLIFIAWYVLRQVDST